MTDELRGRLRGFLRFDGSDFLRRVGRTRLADVDAALEERAVLDRDALRHDVAGQRTFVADVHAVGRGQVALELADHDDLTRVHVRVHHAVAAHGHAVAGQVDGAFD